MIQTLSTDNPRHVRQDKAIEKTRTPSPCTDSARTLHGRWCALGALYEIRNENSKGKAKGKALRGERAPGPRPRAGPERRGAEEKQKAKIFSETGTKSAALPGPPAITSTVSSRERLYSFIRLSASDPFVIRCMPWMVGPRPRPALPQGGSAIAYESEEK